ncbi:hypothetical protein Gorai_016731 [Gossypium raimondii]|uniref:Uncharacterized protein n=1 Tax=Gossypium raimondii TaxID=29730 RepID=A0A7J8P9N9_GOSRA|nr:hypothetical protein [Gossypium raimondii]
MLIGSKRSSRKEVLETDVDDVQLFEGDVTVGTKDGIPSIRSSDRVHQILYKIMSRTVVVKLLGMEIGYHALSNKIYNLWKLLTPITIMDIENDYFFSNYMKKMTMSGHLLKDQKLGSETVALNLSARSSGSKVNHKEVEKFGPWMLVDWLTKRTNQSKGIDKVVKESANPKGSRFTALLNLRDNKIDIV